MYSHGTIQSPEPIVRGLFQRAQGLGARFLLGNVLGEQKVRGMKLAMGWGGVYLDKMHGEYEMCGGFLDIAWISNRWTCSVGERQGDRKRG